MVALTTPICNFNEAASDFSLPDTQGLHWSLEQAKGEKGLLVMFICNHCPYVKAILPQLVADCLELKQAGINAIAIMSNDTASYPEDGIENMAALAEELDFPFPYVIDATQEIAKAYGAVCTPDFFGYNQDLALQYRGRFDASGMNRVQPRAEKELLAAMLQVAETGFGPAEQKASIGCSIKWCNA